MLSSDYSIPSQLIQRYKSGAHGFYWVAGLTIITSVITLSGGGWGFVISLGTTQIIDAVANSLSGELGAAKGIALVLDIVIAGTFVGFGLLANKRYLWVYIVGMVVFLLDGFVSLLIQDWLGVLGHAYILFIMFRGFQAGRELSAYEKEIAESNLATSPQPEPAV